MVPQWTTCGWTSPSIPNHSVLVQPAFALNSGHFRIERPHSVA
jgi:hypothetical protein